VARSTVSTRGTSRTRSKGFGASQSRRSRRGTHGRERRRALFVPTVAPGVDLPDDVIVVTARDLV
jgi:hypothetical protein